MINFEANHERLTEASSPIMTRYQTQHFIFALCHYLAGSSSRRRRSLDVNHPIVISLTRAMVRVANMVNLMFNICSLRSRVGVVS